MISAAFCRLWVQEQPDEANIKQQWLRLCKYNYLPLKNLQEICRKHEQTLDSCEQIGAICEHDALCHIVQLGNLREGMG